MALVEPSSRNPDGSRRPPEGENVGVFARLRPEAAGTKKGELTVKNRFGEQRTCTVRNLEFSLDWVFDEDAAQEDVYEVAARERVAGVRAVVRRRRAGGPRRVLALRSAAAAGLSALRRPRRRGG